jgi:hypothetical protein
LLLFLFTLLSAGTYAQVNAYASVTGISVTGGKSKLAITNVNQSYHTFTAGEQVIVIQMQDDVISGTNNNSSFGLLSSIQMAGIYEVATISAVTSTSITLTGKLTNTFNFNTHSQVQVVSFTLLGGGGNYTTTGAITAVPWNGTTGTGGIVAFQVGGILTLNHPVTADGQGFAGGASNNINSTYENGCETDVYRVNDDNYGYKGEGIYLRTSTNQLNGRARILTGGGGGSSDNGGGAGGGNYTAGGNGGPGWTCAATPTGGLGGIALSSYMAAGSRLFLGGGGGGGQGNNGHQTSGGNGGGIVIIKATTLVTGCSSSVRISANGSAAASTANGGNDGAGGAGAAGTILLQVGSYGVPSTCPLSIQANGGNGGDVTDAGAHGGGGGGGQGAIIFFTGSPSSNISYSTKPGTGGLNSSSSTDRADNGAGNNNAGVIGGAGVVLPVNVIYFGAEKKSNQAQLTWTSVGDNETVTYRVQRSANGVDFTTIGTVKGTGNGSNRVNYTYNDAGVVMGKNYYRVEIAGSLSTAGLSYTGIAAVNFDGVQSVPVAYPNPAHDHFYLRVSNPNTTASYTVTITDLTGQVVFTSASKPAGGIITVSINRPLKPGLYMYKLNGTDQTGKLMIQ